MNWSVIGYNFVRFIIPLVLASLAFASKIQKRDHFYLRLLLGLIVYTGLSMLITEFSENIRIGTWFYTHFFFIMFLTSVFVYSLFKITVKEALFFTAAAYTIQNLTDNFNALIFLQAGEPTSMALQWTIFIVPYLFTYTAYYFIFVKLIEPKFTALINNWVFISVLLIVLGIVYVLSMYSTMGSAIVTGTTDESVSTRIYAIIACGLSLLLEFNVFSNTSLEMEKKNLEQVLETENENNIRNQKNYELISMKVHDIRHNIRILKEKTDSEEIKSSLDSLEEDTRIFNTATKTGSKALDTVLSDRSLYCAKHKITITCMADGTKLSFIKDIDIFSIFGNALDNAIDSLENEEIENRNIVINIKTSMGFLLIHIDNYCKNHVTFVDGLPQTTKDRKDLHGYGSKSMAYIVNKYNGTIVFSQENDIFNVNITLPIKE
ncbi:MAG: ATP-binding protein [Bacilli bacterium]